MIAFDTHIMLHATVPTSPYFKAGQRWFNALATEEVAVCELALAEFYCLLRSPAIMAKPANAKTATDAVQAFRSNVGWRLVENAPVMDKVWQKAREDGFARRRIYDIRLGLTLLHHGVTRFATFNVKDFQDLGFERVWNPFDPARG